MMEEEDDFDLPATPDMDDVDKTFPANDGPTLMVAGASSQNAVNKSKVTDDKPEKEGVNTVQADPATKDVKSEAITRQEIMKDTQKSEPENLGLSKQTDEKAFLSEPSQSPGKDTDDKRKELFGDTQETDSFGMVDSGKHKDSLPTASGLFGNSGDTKDLFGSNGVSDSFGIVAKTESEFMRTEQNVTNQSTFDSAFGNLSIGETTVGSNLGIQQAPCMPPAAANSIIFTKSVVNGHNEGTQPAQSQGVFSIQSPAANSIFPPVSTNISPIANAPYQQQTLPSTNVTQSSMSPLSQQSQMPLFYNPQQFQQQQQSILPTQNNVNQPNTQQSPAQTTYAQFPITTYAENMLPTPNTADVGNSYMYTSPIASVIPGYDTTKNQPAQLSQPANHLQGMQNNAAQNQPPQLPHPSNYLAGMQNNEAQNIPPQIPQPSNHFPGMQNSQQNTKQTSGLFVPDLYGGTSVSKPSQVNIFTPDAPTLNIETQTYNPGSMTQMNYNTPNPYQNAQQQNNPYGITNMEQIPLSNQPDFYHNADDPGFWQWVKSQDWGEEAQRIGKQILQKTKYTLEWVGTTVYDGATKGRVKKNATDTVLTTLDPGMEEYLNPVVHLAIASQDNKILQAVRQGFKNVFGHTAAKGHNGQHSLAKLPIGFEAGIRAAAEQLDSISTIDFRFSQPYIHVAFQPFLTELQQGSWSCMFCMVVRDSSKQIQLNSFSQPISLPSACVSIAFSKTPQDDVQKKFGFSISIDEAVRLYEPYTADQDWCSTLSGIRLDALIAMASQGLASDYKRELGNPAMQNVESFVVMS